LVNKYKLLGADWGVKLFIQGSRATVHGAGDYTIGVFYTDFIFLFFFHLNMT